MSEDNRANKPEAGRREPGFGAIFETAITSGLGAAAAALPTMNPAAVASALGLGALAGGVTQSAAQIRARLLESADERVEHAREEEVEAASLDVARLKREFEEFRVRLGSEVRTALGERALHRVAALGNEVLRRIHAGELDAKKLDAEHRDALVEATRFSLDALHDETVPMIARLAMRPTVDHFFRGTCRVLVDLDADELAQLTTLIGQAARAIPRIVREWESDHSLRTLFQPHTGDIELDGTTEQGELGPRAKFLQWRPLRGQDGLRVPAQSQLVPLLIGHRLGRPPDDFTGRLHGDPMSGIHFDNRVMTMQIATILELHFVLMGERIADPGFVPTQPTAAGPDGDPSPAEAVAALERHGVAEHVVRAARAVVTPEVTIAELVSATQTVGEQPAAAEINVLWAHGLKRLRAEGATVEAANLERRRDDA